MQQAPLWVERLGDEKPAEAWSADWTSAPRKVPPAVLRPPVRFRQTAVSLDEKAIVFELSGDRRHGQAWLFVLKPKGTMPDCPSAPPLKPCSLTGGRQVAYWQSDGMLYVLVMNGSIQDYHATLRCESPV